MPAAYAHMVFGSEIRKKLPMGIQSIINRYPELYGIGLQGPDILFYTHPSGNQAAVLYGHNIHKRPVSDFFRVALDEMDAMEELDWDKGTAYLMGFLCHFILDSGCHPLVRKNTIPGIATHREIEREFDRFLMEKDGVRPEWFFPWTRTVPMAEKDAGVISCFYPEADTRVIRRGIRNMRLYETFTTGYRMRKTNNLQDLSQKMEECMGNQIPEASEKIEAFFTGDMLLLLKGFDRNFG